MSPARGWPCCETAPGDPQVAGVYGQVLSRPAIVIPGQALGEHVGGRQARPSPPPIGRLFHVRYTPHRTSYLLHRLGFTPQVPVHRAAERDEAAIAGCGT
jgi:Winged helix-turn helix